MKRWGLPERTVLVTTAAAGCSMLELAVRMDSSILFYVSVWIILGTCFLRD